MIRLLLALALLIGLGVADAARAGEARPSGSAPEAPVCAGKDATPGTHRDASTSRTETRWTPPSGAHRRFGPALAFSPELFPTELPSLLL